MCDVEINLPGIKHILASSLWEDKIRYAKKLEYYKCLCKSNDLLFHFVCILYINSRVLRINIFLEGGQGQSLSMPGLSHKPNRAVQRRYKSSKGNKVLCVCRGGGGAEGGKGRKGTTIY